MDVGAGTGALSERLARSGATIICLEPDAASLALARRRLAGYDVEFVESPVEHIPPPDASADAVVASVTAHHWADQDAGFAELARVLRPGGRLIMAEFRPGGHILRKLREFAGSKHVNSPGLTTWRTRLLAAGFQDVQAEPAGWAARFALFLRATR